MENMAFSLISILIFALLLFFFLKTKFTKSLPLPPGPYPWPLVGNLFQMIRNDPHVTLAQLARKHGPLMSLRLGSQLLVVASTPDSAAQILKTHDRVLSGRAVPHGSYLKDPELNNCSVGFTFECNEHWKYLRTLLKSEMFLPKAVEDQGKLREKKVGEVVEYLRSMEGEMVKIGQVLFVSNFNFLGNVFFSKDLIGFSEGEKAELYQLIRKSMELWIAPNVSDLYPVLGRFDLQGISIKAGKIFVQTCDVWKGIIEERREKKGEKNIHGDLLDAMLQNDFTDDQINCLFLELFAAGTDTSASIVEWTIVELLRNKYLMNKINEELEREIGGRNYVAESDLSNLTYLQACVKETLRLHPPAPLLLPRRATQDCEVMNYMIPKDATIMVNVWAIATDPSSWDEPLRFMPERFLDNPRMDFKGNNFEYLPFGGGRRICAGLPMAVRQVQLALASLLYHFEWSIPQGMKADELKVNEKYSYFDLQFMPSTKKR